MSNKVGPVQVSEFATKMMHLQAMQLVNAFRNRVGHEKFDPLIPLMLEINTAQQRGAMTIEQLYKAAQALAAERSASLHKRGLDRMLDDMAQMPADDIGEHDSNGTA